MYQQGDVILEYEETESTDLLQLDVFFLTLNVDNVTQIPEFNVSIILGIFFFNWMVRGTTDLP